jgi:cobalamin biosynthesis protein CobT
MDNTVTALKQMVERDKEFGVECVGIGILDTTVKQIYKKSVSIQKVEDLSGTIFNKLSEVLLDGGVKF